MKKRYYVRILTIVLVFVLCICLAGCRDKTGEIEEDESGYSSEESTGNGEGGANTQEPEGATDSAIDTASVAAILGTENGYKSTDLGSREVSNEKTGIRRYVEDVCSEFPGVSVDTVSVLHDTSNNGYYKVNLIATYKGKEDGVEAAAVLNTDSAYLANRLEVYKENVSELKIVWLHSRMNGSATFKYLRNMGILEVADRYFDSRFGVVITDGEIKGVNADQEFDPTVNPDFNPN